MSLSITYKYSFCHLIANKNDSIQSYELSKLSKKTVIKIIFVIFHYFLFIRQSLCTLHCILPAVSRYSRLEICPRFRWAIIVFEESWLTTGTSSYTVQMNEWIPAQMNKQTNKQTDKQTNKQTNKQTIKQTTKHLLLANFTWTSYWTIPRQIKIDELFETWNKCKCQVPMS